MRTKVKAQRKFAQGTIVPAVSTLNNNSFPKNDTTVHEENITFSNMSAKNLLDIISIQGVLPQLQRCPLSAYVRIERLENKKSSSNENAPKKTASTAAPAELSQSKQVRRLSSPVLLRSHVQPRLRFKRNRTKNRKFRQSLRTITKKNLCKYRGPNANRAAGSEFDDDRPLILLTKSGATSRKRRVPGPTSVEDNNIAAFTDDDPDFNMENGSSLNISGATRRSQRKNKQRRLRNTSSRIIRTGTNVQQAKPIITNGPAAPPSRTVGVVQGNKRHVFPPTLKRRLGKDAAPKKGNKQENKPSTSSSIKGKMVSKRSRMEDSSKTKEINLPNAPGDSPNNATGKAKGNRKTKGGGQHVPVTHTGDKEPSKPSISTGRRGIKINDADSDSSDQRSNHVVLETVAVLHDVPDAPRRRRSLLYEEQTTVTMSNASICNDIVPIRNDINSAGTSAPVKLYDANNILNWMNNDFKSPAVPRPSTSRVPPPETSGRNCTVDLDNISVCPSERYTSLPQILKATHEELNNCCRNCACCARISKAVELNNVVRRHLAHEDIYEFDCNDNTESLQPFRSSRDDTEETCQEKIYLDFGDKNGNELVELNLLCTKYGKKVKIFRVAKNKRQKITDILAQENEKQVDRMLSNFTEGRSMQSNERVETATTLPDSPISRTCTSKSSGKLIDAPVFRPTEAEFLDPITFFEKIVPIASKHGICKVIPPKGFKPPCKLNDEFRFSVTNQYLPRLYSRWGPASREMAAIKSYLASQEVVFARCPLIDGVEVNLPKLYHIVQRHGGLDKIIEKKRWSKVVEEMAMTGGPNPEKKLDSIYVKYLLPYGTLADKERNQVIACVEKGWQKKNVKLLDRARNPLHRQKKILQESESSEEETDDDNNVVKALGEAEDCIVPGRKMNLAVFKKVATHIMSTHFPSGSPSVQELERMYWRYVLCGVEHVCVNAASIDTGEEGYGFPKHKQGLYGKHPWNLKTISQNEGNVLRALGPVLGITVPTLHVGMVFATSCWHSDPQGMPWVEYHHQGDTKIWYGIPQSESDLFRKAVEKLCPTSCQNKSIWLPSDITMIPPSILCENKVSLSRVEQNPGEFIIVCPKAYSCSISTGYAVSESVYFATNDWLNSVHQVYQELRDSCEPTMFPLEHLLLSMAKDQKTPLSILQQVLSNLNDIVEKEFSLRLALEHLPSKMEPRTNSKKRQSTTAWNVRELDECEICRAPLYLSKVVGVTSKKSAHCLEHAKHLTCTPKYAGLDNQRLMLVQFLSTAELRSVMDKVKTRLTIL